MRKLLYLLIAALILSCDKDPAETDNIATRVTTTRVEKQISQGLNSGATFYPPKGSGITAKDGDGMFISNFPFVEYRYLQNVVYDSIITQVLDTVTMEVLSETIERPIISRDTIGVETGPLWQTFNTQNPTRILVGLDTEFLETTVFKVTINVTDSLDSGEVGLLFSYYSDLQGQPAGAFPQNSKVDVPKEFTTIVDDIPTYNELGQITGYSSGIELTTLLTKHYQVLGNTKVTRTFNITVESSNGSEVSTDFSFTFVPGDVWADRQCWLENYFECKDLF